MKKPTYIKCPRCELNYIKSTDRYCLVCMAELKLAGEPFGTDGDEELELCPVCGQNFISPEQKMCEDCKRQNEYDEDNEELNNSQDDGDTEPESVDSWEDEDSDDSNGDVELVPLSSLDDDDFEDDDEESEEEDSDRIGMDEEDDFEYDDFDDIDENELDEDDYDDEDEEDEDDD